MVILQMKLINTGVLEKKVIKIKIISGFKTPCSVQFQLLSVYSSQGSWTAAHSGLLFITNFRVYSSPIPSVGDASNSSHPLSFPFSSCQCLISEILFQEIQFFLQHVQPESNGASASPVFQ